MTAHERNTRCYRRLRQAVARNTIRPWYQPLVCGPKAEVAGCEMLARWHRLTGVTGADCFIPLAERTGLILPMTRRLMRQAQEELSSLRGLLPDGFRVSVNISAAHAGAGTFLRDCLQLRQALSFCRGEVCAEITERAAFEDVPGAAAFIARLREAGVLVYLDDFYTGCTGMATLAALRVDGLKLDRVFVDVLARRQVAAKTAFILSLAQARCLDVTAEGVETPDQHNWLLEQGVMWQQGYLFAPPLPVAGLRDWLIARQSAGAGGGQAK